MVFNMQTEQLEGFKLSPQQKRLWLLQQNENTLPYRVKCEVSVTGNLNFDILKTVLESIVERYEILRTNFCCLPGMTVPLQVITDISEIKIYDFNLTYLPYKEQKNRIETIFAELTKKPFKSEKDILFHVCVITLSPIKHILMLSLSASIADSFTLKKLLGEISSSYAACLENKYILDEPMQYADIAEWQNELIESKESELGKEYWRKQNVSSLDHLKLWFEKRQGITSQFQPQYFSLNINNDLSKHIELLANTYKVNKPDLLLVCWLILLWKITRQSDISVGITVDGRKYEELEQALGPLSKVLPFSYYLEAELKFSEILKEVNKLVNDAYESQEYFIWQENVNSKSFCPVNFEFEEAPEIYHAGNLLLSLDKHYSRIDKFKIKLSCLQRNDTLIVQFYYDSNLYNLQDVQTLSEQFQNLLTSVIENPESSIGRLNILDDRKRQQLLVEFNNTQKQYPQDKCIHEIFEEQAEQTPDKLAVVCDSEQLTYSELNSKADLLANHLKRLGVKPETLVGLYLDRSRLSIIGLLGILKAGAAYLPLDSVLPTEGLAFRLQDAGVSVVLTQRSLLSKIPKNTKYTVCLDTDWETIEEDRDSSHRQVQPDNLVYAIYTSGSTGTPKAVAVEHRQLVNYLYSVIERLNILPGASFATVSTLAADLGNTMLFPALCTGGCLHIIDQETATDPLAFSQYCQHHPIDCLKIVPSHLSALLSSSSETEFLPRKKLILGGEASNWQLITKIRQQQPDCEIFNHYGPTETTVGVLTYPIEATTSNESTTVPIGQPLPNNQVYILDEQLQPVPIGVPGELHIGGAQASRGYLNRPELTTEKFIPNPFSTIKGNRIYKTGDLARYLPNGDLEYLGRIDHQVKVRGFRIELGEIEAAIAQNPAVRETVVTTKEDLVNSKQIIAYVVLQEQQKLTISELREFLASKLPSYMVPAALVTLEALPLTPNGKVDRKALPALEKNCPELEKTYVAPQTIVEKQLAIIWAEVLGLENVGIFDNFFTLGGDSILSIQVIAKATLIGLHLTPKQLFQHQTIAKLAAVAGTTRKVRAEQGMLTGKLELLPIQHWFFEQEQPEPHHWNQAVLLVSKQKINPVDLEKIIDSLQKHHDVLRLRFTQEEFDTKAHIISPNNEIPLTCFDFSLLSEDKQTTAIEAAASKLQASLNLSKRPLFQVALFDLGNDQAQRLLWIIHHLAVDGVSWRILLDDFQTAHQQINQGQAIKPPPKTSSYQQWSSRLQEYAQSDELLAEEDFWLERQSKSISPIPRDFSHGKNIEDSGATVSVSLSEEETQILLQQVPSVYRTQINDILLTALALTFNQWTEENSLLIDLEGHGREEIFEDVDLSRTVGWFTTIFPVHLQLENVSDLGTAIKSIKEQLREIPNRGIGYGLLRYLSQNQKIAKQLSSSTAEVAFNYLGQFKGVLAESSLFGSASESSGAGRSRKGKRNHLLTINSGIYQGNLELSWSYSTNLHRQSTIEALARNYVEILRSLIAHCQSSDAGGLTPSDFADFQQSQWSQTELDTITAAIGGIKNKNIEDFYPLSPMQQGILFHSFADSESGVYFLQSSWNLKGTLNVAAFRRAWQKVIERHSILRTSFVWESREEPVQIVHRRINLPWQEYDWQHLSPEKQQQKLELFLRRDRANVFELKQAPLMRLALIQLSDASYNFTWSRHHLLLDGWSTASVFKEVFAYYKAFHKNKEISLESIRPYRDYIVWLQQQNLSLAENFWRQTLKGFTSPTRLSVGRRVSLSSQTDNCNEGKLRLSRTTTAALQSFAKQHQLTLNTIVQGAWALILRWYSGQEDVVFGAVTSGRSPTLAKAESMVGLFINTIPVRVQVSPEEILLPWLHKIKDFLIEARQYEYCPLVKVQGWSEIPKSFSLFESVVVFENYAVDPSVRQSNINLEIETLCTFVKTSYPISLVVNPDEELSLKIICADSDRFDNDTITWILRHLQTVLENIVVNQEQQLDGLSEIVDKQPDIYLQQLIEILNKSQKQQQIIENQEFNKACRQKLGKVSRKTARDIS